jgi:hypothetical protein
MWRVAVYDRQGNLICYHNVTTRSKAERVALDVTRKAAVSTKITEVQHNETKITH